MGEAKRRKEQFRKTSRTCVFCGGVATTDDHVPAKNLFIPPRPRQITVPACENCNGGMSALEDEFRVFVSAKSGPDTPESIELWKKGGLRSVRSNSRLRRELVSGMKLWVRDPYGQFGQTYKWPRENHDRVVEKITRGLYYHHFHEILKTTDVLEITFLNSLNEDLKKTVLTMQHGNIGGIHRFAYAFGRTPEEPKLSLWIYQFYTRHWAGVVTKPADFEFSALDNDRALA